MPSELWYYFKHKRLLFRIVINIIKLSFLMSVAGVYALKILNLQQILLTFKVFDNV